MKTILLLLLCVLCGSIYAQKKGIKTSQAPKKNTTTIRLSENTFDFGQVHENGYVSKAFTIRNTGTQNLYLGEISALCVMADYSFEPILPGESSTITISFSTEGKIGEQYRAIPIKGNIENKEAAMIYVKGIVFPRQ